MRQIGPMKYSGPSARRNAGASPGRIQSRTSGMSVMRREANSPSCGRILQLHDARLGCERDDRDGVGPARQKILHDQSEHPVVRVFRDVDLALHQLLGRVLVSAVVHDVTAGGAVHRGVEHLRERGTSLDDVIRHQRERILLGKDDGLVVERAVLEAEHESGLHSVAAYDLREISLRELLVVGRAQGRKRSRHAFRVTNGHGAGNRGTDVRDRESKDKDCHSRPAHWATSLTPL